MERVFEARLWKEREGEKEKREGTDGCILAVSRALGFFSSLFFFMWF